MRHFVSAVLTVAVLGLFPAAIGCGKQAAPPQLPALPANHTIDPKEFQLVVSGMLQTDTPDFFESSRIAEATARFYQVGGYSPAWSTLSEPLPQTEELLGALANAASHGLDPEKYGLGAMEAGIRAAYARKPLDAKEIARLDLLLSYTFMRFANDLKTGRVDPQKIVGGLYSEPVGLDLAGLLETAFSENSVAQTLDALAPQSPAYRALREAIPVYERYVAEGGWPIIDSGAPLRPGDTDSRVAALRARLTVTGELRDTGNAGSNRYDSELSEAVKRFQRRHGLEPDGVIGTQSLLALNIPASDRLAQIKANLERWRWLPQEFHDHAATEERHIVVNVPEFSLRGYEGKETGIEMAVVVGTVYDERATPIFMEKMTYLIFSPYWNAPPKIAKEELVPPAMRDTSYMAKHHYEIVNHFGPSAQVFPVDPTTLRRVASGRLRIRQRPGPWNALGHVKFLFPNQFSVYLHDTPEDHLFKRARRAFSHGCIRVERPEELAVWVLARDEKWTTKKIREAMHRGVEQQVNLATPIPVYILYWTVFPGEDGALQFREDLYGYDPPLTRALLM